MLAEIYFLLKQTKPVLLTFASDRGFYCHGNGNFVSQVREAVKRNAEIINRCSGIRQTLAEWKVAEERKEF